MRLGGRFLVDAIKNGFETARKAMKRLPKRPKTAEKPGLERVYRGVLAHSQGLADRAAHEMLCGALP